MTVTTLDIEKSLTNINEHGIPDFCWPYNRMSTMTLQKNLYKELYILHNQMSHSPEIQAILEIVSISWVKSVVHIGYNQLLANYFLSKNFNIECGPRFHTLQSLLNTSKPELESYLTVLKEGPPQYPAWKWPLRMVKQTIKKAYIKSKPITVFSQFHKPVTSLITPLCHQYAKKIEKEVDYIEIHSFFSKINKTPQLQTKHRDFIQQLLEIASRCLENFNIKPSVTIHKWLEENFTYSFLYALHHINKLKQKKHLPKELWIGSGSCFWPRIFAKEVILRDGKVIAFDHGSGSGQFQEGALPFIIKGLVSEFITYSNLNAYEVQRSLDNKGFRCPKVKVTSIRDTDFEMSIKQVKGNNITGMADTEYKTVMLLPLSMVGERINALPFPDDMITQDFNARLVSQLSNAGWKVLLKPHPGFDFSKMRKFESLFNAEILNGKYEEQAHKADVILFTAPATSTFLWSIQQNLNIVLLDLGITNWTDSFAQKYKTKVPIIKGYFKDNVRFDCNFNHLCQILTDSLNKTKKPSIAV